MHGRPDNRRNGFRPSNSEPSQYRPRTHPNKKNPPEGGVFRVRKSGRAHHPISRDMGTNRRQPPQPVCERNPRRSLVFGVTCFGETCCADTAPSAPCGLDFRPIVPVNQRGFVARRPANGTISEPAIVPGRRSSFSDSSRPHARSQPPNNRRMRGSSSRSATSVAWL